ncbi:myosin-G heavy chain-like [Argonauta hians]
MNDSDKFFFKKRSKKRNFSEKEVAILTREYENHMIILNSKLTNSITNQKKQRIWERITDAINAVGINRRRVSEVKEKWRNMQRKARRMFAERKTYLRTFESLDGLDMGGPCSVSGPGPSLIGSGSSSNNSGIRLTGHGGQPDQTLQQQQQSHVDVQLESLPGAGVVMGPVDGIVGSSVDVQVSSNGNDPGYSLAAAASIVSNSINSSCTLVANTCNNDSSNNNSDGSTNNNNGLVTDGVANSGDCLVNGPNGDNLTIVIKEEIPDEPILKDEPLLVSEIQPDTILTPPDGGGSNSGGGLGSGVSGISIGGSNKTEILTEAVATSSTSLSENTTTVYDSHNNKFTINLTDNSPSGGATTTTTFHSTRPRTPSRAQRLFATSASSNNSSRFRTFSGAGGGASSGFSSSSTRRMFSSPLSSVRTFSRNRSARNALLRSGNSNNHSNSGHVSMISPPAPPQPQLNSICPSSSSSLHPASGVATSSSSSPLSSQSSMSSRTLSHLPNSSSSPSYRSYPLTSSVTALGHTALGGGSSAISATNPRTVKLTHQRPSASAPLVTQDDLLQLQYEVLLADKKRIQTQTRYYEMKMKRMDLELSGQSTNTFF